MAFCDSWQLHKISAINFSAMSNAIDADNLIGVSNFVDHTIVTDAYPPIVFTAGKLSATCRSRISRKRVNGADNSIVN